MPATPGVSVAEILREIYPVSPGLAQYLVHVSPQHKYVYIETPKVACSTIKRTLQLVEVGGDRARLSANVHDRESSPLLGPFSPGIDIGRVMRGDGFTLFCFVRNPFSRVVSAYIDKVLMGGPERERILSSMGFDPRLDTPFAGFLETLRDMSPESADIHFAPQSFLLQPRRLNYGFIGRFESFDHDFQWLLRHIAPDSASGDGVENIREHAVGGGNFIPRLVGRDESRLIREIYREDFANFGYGTSWVFAG